MISTLLLCLLSGPPAVLIVILICGGCVKIIPCINVLAKALSCCGICCRALLYCLPCCWRRDPDDIWDLDGEVDLDPQEVAGADLEKARAQARARGGPPANWVDPVPLEERIHIERDDNVPACALWKLLMGTTGSPVDWLRPHEFLKGQPTLFGTDGPTPMDLVQGELGNCYLLSTIASLAEQPWRIKRLFLQDDISTSGLYCVFLAKHGKWHEVWVSDLIPCEDDKDGKPKPLSVAPKEGSNKLWPLLLEKAYVTLYGEGKYTSIDGGGYPQFTMHCLTNCPVVRYDTRMHSEDSLWEALNSDMRSCACVTFCDNKPLSPHLCIPSFRHKMFKFRSSLAPYPCLEIVWDAFKMFWLVVRLMCCLPIDCCTCFRWLQKKCCGSGGCSGIVEGHAYSVLNVLEVPDGNGGTERLVKIRNPWGDTGWQGRYSKNSSAWTEEAEELAEAQAELDGMDEGTSYIELADFIAYFGGVGICYMHPGAYRTPLTPGEKETGTPKQALMTPMTNRSGSGPWHFSSFSCNVNSDALRKQKGTPRCGCELIIPAVSEVFITVDDGVEENGESYYGGLGHRWCIHVFDLSTGNLVGRNEPYFRVADSDCSPLHDSGPFDELISLSTTRMDLAAGNYEVKVAWHPLQRYLGEGAPEKIVFVVTSSAPGARMKAPATSSRNPDEQSMLLP